MYLDKANNANPKFSNQLVPIHVWIMHTSHAIDSNEVKTDLSFVPAAILNKMLETISNMRNDSKESHMYVVAHDVEADDYKVYTGHALTASKEKGFGFSNLITTQTLKEDCIQSTKLQELHVQYRPDWNGKREDPQSHDAETFDEMMTWLEENKLKDVFLKVFPSSDVYDNPVTALTPSPITKKQVKPTKITKAKRAALVKRFGEANIKKLEERIKNKKKDDQNKKG